MATNLEKKSNLLNRYIRLVAEGGEGVEQRPSRAASVDSLPEARKWVKSLTSEIKRVVGHIQNDNMPESQVRDLNDEINHLLRTKKHWDARVEELGGPKAPPDPFSSGGGGGGMALRGSRYLYFGSAKTLPGVKELFEAQAAAEDESRARKTRADLYRGIDGDYYGFRDDEAGHLGEAEENAERVLRERAVVEFFAAKTQREEDEARRGSHPQANDANRVAAMELSGTTGGSSGSGGSGEGEGEGEGFAHARKLPYASAQYAVTPETLASLAESLPSLEEVEAALVAFRKAEILADL